MNKERLIWDKFILNKEIEYRRRRKSEGDQKIKPLLGMRIDHEGASIDSLGHIFNH